MLEQALDRAGVDDLAAVLTRAGADVDDPVGVTDGVLVVLDHDQGVAEVLEADQGLDQPLVVALVEADRRLVEDVEDADQAGADLGRQPDPLGLTAAEGARGPVEGEVVEADVEQEVEPLQDLLEHPLADLALAGGELDGAEVVGALVDREGADLGDVLAAAVLVAERDRHGHRLEAAALADRARHLAHEALEPLAADVGLRLAVAALDVALHPLELGVVGPLAAVAVAGDDVDLARVAEQQRLLALGGDVLPRRVEVEAELLAERVHQLEEVVGDVGLAPRLDRALAEGRGRVGHDQLGVDLHAGAQAVALGAGAERRVERERPGLELVGVDRVVVGARHPLGELLLAAGVLGVEVDEVEHHQPGGQVERRLDRVGQPALGGRLDREPVDDHLDGVLALLVEGGRAVERVGLAVDPGPREPLRLQLPEELDVLALATSDDRGQHLERGPLLESQDPVDDLLGRLPLDRRPAGRAVGAAGAG